MRTDSLRNNDNEDLIAQSLLHHQIEYAGMRHPNFHSSMTTVNPDRPLTDIPDPSPRYQQSLSKLLSISRPMRQVMIMLLKRKTGQMRQCGL